MLFGKWGIHLMRGRRFRRPNDTCRYAYGQSARGVLSSSFWQFFEFWGFLTCFNFGFLIFPSLQNRSSAFGFLSPFSGEFSPILALFLSALRFVNSSRSS